MKRLKKKSSFESDFLIQWLDDWESISSFKVEKILSNNPDCLYSGDAYRVLFLSNIFIGGRITQWNGYKANKESVNEAIKQKIYNDDNYVSFSQTTDGSLFFAYNNTMDGEIAWLLKSNVSGLDLNKLYDKYKNQLEGKEFAYDGYQEVISQLNEFEIVGCILDNKIYEQYSMIEKVDENGKFKGYDIQIEN